MIASQEPLCSACWGIWCAAVLLTALAVMYHVTQCHRQGHRYSNRGGTTGVHSLRLIYQWFDQNVEKKMQVERILVVAPPGVDGWLSFCPRRGTEWPLNRHCSISSATVTEWSTWKRLMLPINVGVYERVPVYMERMKWVPFYMESMKWSDRYLSLRNVLTSDDCISSFIVADQDVYWIVQTKMCLFFFFFKQCSHSFLCQKGKFWNRTHVKLTLLLRTLGVR